MASSIKQSSQIGKFRSSANSAPVARRAESLRKTLALDAHESASAFKKRRPSAAVTPATDVDELQGQIGKLIKAFKSSENRDPGVRDTGFWKAYAQAVRAYSEAAEPGSWDGI